MDYEEFAGLPRDPTLTYRYTVHGRERGGKTVQVAVFEDTPPDKEAVIDSAPPTEFAGVRVMRQVKLSGRWTTDRSASWTYKESDGVGDGNAWSAERLSAEVVRLWGDGQRTQIQAMRALTEVISTLSDALSSAIVAEGVSREEYHELKDAVSEAIAQGDGGGAEVVEQIAPLLEAYLGKKG